MARCQFCGKKVDLPFRCNYCGGHFCEEHRLPPKHNCPNIAQWRGKASPPKTRREKRSYSRSRSSKSRVRTDDNWVPVNVKTKKSGNAVKYIIAAVLLVAVMSAVYPSYLPKQLTDAIPQNLQIGSIPLSETPTPQQTVPPSLPQIEKCDDGTPYGSCSATKPLFCENGSLIEKASLCGCPEKYIPNGDECVYQLTLVPESRSLSYCNNGLKTSIPFTVYRGLKEYLSELPRTFVCDPECPSDQEIYQMIINQPDQVEFIQNLIKMIKIVGQSKDEQARISISLVQMIPYDYEKVFTLSSENWRYPYEVLYDYKGVCQGKSLLLALLLRELGFGVVLLVYEDENHMAVGIKCPGRYANYIYQGSGYCFIETTTPSIVTDMSGEYLGVGALKSKPKIYFVSDGGTLLILLVGNTKTRESGRD